MQTPRSRRTVARVLCALFPYRETRHARWMIGAALVPALLVWGVFELFLTDSAIARLSRIDRSAVGGHDLAPLFTYYISWVAHVCISLGVGLLAAHSAFRNTSEPKKSVLRSFRILVPLAVLLVILAADAMHCNLAVLSHQRLFNVLALEPSLLPMFRTERTFNAYTVWAPTTFSFFPVSAIAAAFWATSTIIMCASKFLVELKRPKKRIADPQKRIAAFCDALEELRSHFMALSLVLVTSTLATIAYLRTPLGLLSEAERSGFKATADAIGLVWGVMFSLTLLALCIYPFSVLRRCFSSLGTEADLTKDTVLSQWVRENRTVLQVPANLQLVLSTLLPATVAVLANLVSA
jgi:hypothetical protein